MCYFIIIIVDIPEFFYKNIKVIVNVFLITCVQRFLLFAVTYLVYRSFSLNLAGAGVVITLQGMISVAVDMLPLPGAQGISELMYQTVFGTVFAGALLPASVLITRGVSFYLPLIIGAVTTFIFQLTRNKFGRTKEDKELEELREIANG